MIKAFKYRLYPTKAQVELIEKHFNACRFVYNLALETKIYAYKAHGKNLSAYDLINQLTDLKKDCLWLKMLDSQVINATIKIIDASFARFFKGSGFPKFRKRASFQSYNCPNGRSKINWEKSTITLPKIKNIPIVLSRKFDGKIKIIAISKTLLCMSKN